MSKVSSNGTRVESLGRTRTNAPRSSSYSPTLKRVVQGGAATVDDRALPGGQAGGHITSGPKAAATSALGPGSETDRGGAVAWDGEFESGSKAAGSGGVRGFTPGSTCSNRMFNSSYLRLTSS